MKKYRLLKNLPGIDPGAIGEYNESDSQYTFFGPNVVKLDEHIVENSADWFEQVIDYRQELEEMGFEVMEITNARFKVFLHDGKETSIASNSLKFIYEVLKGGLNEH